jgi:hypothetical protein
MTPNQTTNTVSGTEWCQGNFSFPLTFPSVMRAFSIQPQITTNGQLRWAVGQVTANPTVDIYDTAFIGSTWPITGWAISIGN